ncbi:cation efflux family-domain-containing protein [Amylocarpus encephaloides]|uniref:Zinc transporter n=1 Tax=Amylocarpus encephaloides TaxID=45428 RepID=A0A9P8BZP6_9HELO|nr:cation efflux family-domain-containing protein [Amylocarpus encephaloides]
MASSLPIPKPPRTPTPPTPIPEEPEGLGLGDAGKTVYSTVTFDPNALSPLSDTFEGRFGSMGSPLPSSGSSVGSPPGSATFSHNGTMAPPPSGGRNPFNFQTQTISDTPAVAKSNIGQRRGHRYKHSSVSAQHQIFLEPPPRAPLALPASLPIPTFKEAWHSMSKEQTTRIGWCGCHALVAAYVLYSSAGSLALTALSHLIFFDAISATICVVVDVFCNFEVWKRSSIRHPFGLQRAEVLAGFAMSVFLLFMSFDLISHNLKHVLESVGTHQPHHPHDHNRISPGSVDSAALLSIIATLISAIGLKNHARIGRAMRFAYISSLPSILSNPSHFLTLSCSAIMFLLPLLSITMYLWLDRLLCTVIAFSMFFLGTRLAITQGLMLLMSYNGKGVKDVMREITREPMISSIEEARFWQVHFGLCMANLKLIVRGDDAQVQKLRERITVLVRNRLGEGYGRGGDLKWEVTVQFTQERGRL